MIVDVTGAAGEHRPLWAALGGSEGDDVIASGTNSSIAAAEVGLQKRRRDLDNRWSGRTQGSAEQSYADGAAVPCPACTGTTDLLKLKAFCEYLGMAVENAFLAGQAVAKELQQKYAQAEQDGRDISEEEYNQDKALLNEAMGAAYKLKKVFDQLCLGVLFP